MFNEISKINPTAEFDPAPADLKAKLRAAWSIWMSRRFADEPTQNRQQ